MKLIVVDNEFNRYWYRDLIGHVYTPENVPGYVIVRDLTEYENEVWDFVSTDR